MSRQHRWALAFVVAALLVGCTPGVVEPTPSPTPSTATPSPTNSPESAEAAAYRSAKRSFSALIAEVNKVMNSGGANAATTTMKDLAAGPYLEFLSDQVRGTRAFERRTLGSVDVSGLREAGFQPSEVTLRACLDGSQVKVLDKSDEVVGRGTVTTAVLQVRSIAGRWKVWKVEDQVVDSCDDY